MSDIFGRGSDSVGDVWCGNPAGSPALFKLGMTYRGQLVGSHDHPQNPVPNPQRTLANPSVPPVVATKKPSYPPPGGK